MIRILGGEFRSRLLATPRDESTRPMSARAKEGICNLLRGWFEDAVVVDLFAGVGTMSLEAASRGAARVVAVERGRETFRLLERNVAQLGCGDRVQPLRGDALAAATLETIGRRLGAPVDLLFVDPPYETMLRADGRSRVLRQVGLARSLMGERGFVVLRSPLDPDEVDHAVAEFEGPEVHRYGQEMFVLLYCPGGGPRTGDRRGTREDATA